VRASSRLVWTAGVVSPGPSDRVLEVGCGHGVLVSLLADRLPTGVVVGVDRSATMIAAATRRNGPAVDAGRVRLLAASLTEADLAGRQFDVVISVNVRAFWTPPAPEWDVVRRVLAPDGRVVVACSLMGAETEDRVTDAVRRLGGSCGLALTAVHRGRTPPTDSLALELRHRHPNG
jgi:SAM-dependent methyltransferase